MLNNHLAAHPLLGKVRSNLRPLQDRAYQGLVNLAQKGKVRSEENARLGEYEFYDYDVFFRASAAISAVDRLKQSQQFIRTFPRPRSYEKLRINQHIWIEYHYSFYVITLVSLFDIALILTNSVFCAAILRLFDCLLPIYTENSNALHEKWRQIFEKELERRRNQKK